MDKINSRQLFGIPFTVSHPEIFPEEASRGWYVDWNESSPADTVDYFEVTKPNKVTVTLEVKVGIRRVQQ